MALRSWNGGEAAETSTADASDMVISNMILGAIFFLFEISGTLGTNKYEYF
jgi:hypothetical protein